MSLTYPVTASSVSRRFAGPEGSVVAVDDVSMKVEQGSITAITGPSGSGKSTLLQLLAGLDRPDEGSIEIDGEDITRMRDKELSQLRRRRLGFVFQSYKPGAEYRCSRQHHPAA